jgi:hypothetical protein
MKKTLTANISGTVFHIEEDAYEQLQRYLAGIRSNFSGSDGPTRSWPTSSRASPSSSPSASWAPGGQHRRCGARESVMGQPEDYHQAGRGRRC